MEIVLTVIICLMLAVVIACLAALTLNLFDRTYIWFKMRFGKNKSYSNVPEMLIDMGYPELAIDVYKESEEFWRRCTMQLCREIHSLTGRDKDIILNDIIEQVEAAYTGLNGKEKK